MTNEHALATTAYRHLGERSSRELEEVMVRGQTPDPRGLAGWEFRGMNTPFWARLAGIKKFVKGFYENDAGQVYGYNEPVVQNGLDEPWIAKPSDAAPKRFGFFRVDRVDPAPRDNAYLHALLLDYGRGGNGRFDPTAVLRDYLVRVERGSDDLLLGKAYLALGPARVATSYFVLERHRPTDFRRP
jgi:hypothetical protein